MYLCNKNLIPLVHHPATDIEQDDPCPHPHTHFFQSVLILSFRLGLGLPNSLLTSDSLTTNPCVILMPPTRASCFIKLNFSYLRKREMFREKSRLRSFSFYSLSHTPVPYSPSGTNILLSAANPKALSSALCTRTHQ